MMDSAGQTVYLFGGWDGTKDLGKAFLGDWEGTRNLGKPPLGDLDVTKDFAIKPMFGDWEINEDLLYINRSLLTGT